MFYHPKGGASTGRTLCRLLYRAPDDGERETLNQFESEVSAITLEPSKPPPTATSTPTPPQTDTPAPSPTSTLPPTPTDTPVPPPTDTTVPPPTEASPAEPTESSDSSESVPAEPTETSESPEASPPEPAETTEPSDGDVIEPNFDPEYWAQVGDIYSFRSTTSVTWQGLDASGEAQSGSMTYTVGYNQYPPVQNTDFYGDFSGSDELALPAGEGLQTIRIGDTVYTFAFGEIYPMPYEGSGFDPQGLALFAFNGLAAELSGADYQGTTSFDGLEVHRWTFDETNFVDNGDLEEANGSILVLPEEKGGLVHLGVSIRGTNIEPPTGDPADTLKTGAMTMTVALKGLADHYVIELPTEAIQTGELSDDIPVPADASFMQYGLGFLALLSDTDFESLRSFYLTTLKENGWTVEKSDGIRETLAYMEFHKGGRFLMMAIGIDRTSGKTFVSLIEQ